MSNDNDLYPRGPTMSGWIVGIVLALAVLAIGFLAISADLGPQVTKIEVTGQ